MISWALWLGLAARAGQHAVEDGLKVGFGRLGAQLLGGAAGATTGYLIRTKACPGQCLEYVAAANGLAIRWVATAPLGAGLSSDYSDLSPLPILAWTGGITLVSHRRPVEGDVGLGHRARRAGPGASRRHRRWSAEGASGGAGAGHRTRPSRTAPRRALVNGGAS